MSIQDRTGAPAAHPQGDSTVRVSATGIQRVVSAVRMSVSQGGVEVRLRLHPESLGDVQVEVRWKGGQLTARLEAATATARDALEAGLPALRTALREQGVEVDHLQVGLRLDLEGQHSHHELSRQPGAPPDSTFLPGAPGWTEEPAVSAPLSAPVSLARLDLRI